ncbi:MAG: methyltransferase domain-containing protein, partial [Lachnospiraceae bacterium]|nr:methyltransferase domain-containing protein [Lachnospiraceae bacterium]
MNNNDTITYYNQNAAKFCQRTFDFDMSYCQNKFLGYLQKGNCILDAGCGSGRDSKYFMEKGMQVVSMDASEAICQL